MLDMNDSFNSANLPPGTKIGAYHIQRIIASGGMADVYYAIHQELQRPSAIKILRSSLATDEVHLQRFMQEARAAASLIHPNIVQVYDVGQDGEHRYIAQEYIPGCNLRQYLAVPDGEADHKPRAHATTTNGLPSNDRQLSIRETLSILLQVLAALNKSAASGIVHRDIKPENIMLTQDGDVKVADFGLARLLLAEDPQLTHAGTTLGTPMYMSPEQIQEGQVGVRSDLYSLGVTLYHMLAGRPPFTGETPLALAMQHVQAPVPDIDQFRNDVPPTLRELLPRLLAKHPQSRPSSPAEVLETLRSGRHSDLQRDWPDQTVPFPGVVSSNRNGPLQATLELQAKLLPKSARSRRRLLPVLAIIAFLTSSFGIGAMLAFSTPLRLFESQEEFYWDIAKQADAESQYRWALLNTDCSQIAKWEAVKHFFPEQDDQFNRLYAGLASLQLARAQFDRKDPERAREALMTTLDNQAMSKIVRALAYLQLAEIEQAAGKAKERDAAMQQAVEIAATEEAIGSEDLPRLDENVRLMDEPTIEAIWFERRGKK